MSRLTEEDKLRIENLSKEFTTFVLADQDPKHMCFTICYALHLHLMNNGYSNLLSGGRYQGIDHYWLDLGDDDKTIVDPTIGQFNKDAPFVFIGGKPADYLDRSNYNFGESYQCWLAGLLGKNPNLSIEEIRRYISINLKALSILIMETDHKKSPVSDEFKMYLEGLSKALMNYFSSIFDSH